MVLLFVTALENEISNYAKLNPTTVMISRVWGLYAAVRKIKNFSKFWINLVDEAFSAQVSFGSYLNSLFKTTIVSFILQFLTHNSPEHGCDALNCTL